MCSSRTDSDDCDRDRRAALAAAALLLLAPATGLTHTPFRQWTVYRQKHLLIGASKDDAGSYDSAKRLAALFAERLPAAKARVARAPNAARLASLITTDQLPLALLRADQAQALRAGDAPFADYGPFDLRLVAIVDRFLLTAAAGFPEHHAWLIGDALRLRPPTGDAAPLPWHDGSRVFLRGEPIPARPAAADEAPPATHSHH